MAAALDLTELGRADAKLGELSLDEAERQLAREDGDLGVEVLEKIRQGTGMVLVAVRDDNAAQLVLVLEYIGVVGQDQVDTGLIVVGEHEARVDKNHVLTALEGGHVLANTVKAAQGNDLERGRRGLLVVCHKRIVSFRLSFIQKRWGAPIVLVEITNVGSRGPAHSV